MATFVLVPGAWLGARVWDPVSAELIGQGHRVYPVTLSGLAERADVPIAEIGLSTHVDDVVAVLAADDLRDVILVGHSYAGIVTGQVADRVPGRVAHTVFLDANLPVDGQAMTDSWSAGGRRFVHDLVDANAGRWPAPDPADFDGHDLTGEQACRLAAGATGHPGRTLFEPARLARPMAALSATYLVCTRPSRPLAAEVAALHGQPSWRFEELDTGHWPMVSAPLAVADLLDGIARRIQAGPS